MNKGFSLMEVLIVVVITTILLTFVLFSFSGLQKNRSLDQAFGEITSLLEEARSLTLASKDSTAYGVHFETTHVVLFKGEVYVVDSPLNETIFLSSDVSISALSLAGGGSDIVFERLTGSTNQYGSITLSLTSDSSEVKTIVVQTTGLLE